ncbi:MAG: hypothetical protein LBI79_09975 [Nitrososphaerota archaeon]|nr:hypothetical protein [Nitrososphaerota archaeon]
MDYEAVFYADRVEFRNAITGPLLDSWTYEHQDVRGGGHYYTKVKGFEYARTCNASRSPILLAPVQNWPGSTKRIRPINKVYPPTTFFLLN